MAVRCAANDSTTVLVVPFYAPCLRDYGFTMFALSAETVTMEWREVSWNVAVKLGQVLGLFPGTSTSILEENP